MGHAFKIRAAALLSAAVSSCSEPAELLDSARSASLRCAEPAVCPAPIANMTPVIACVSPDQLRISVATTLHIYGSFLEDFRGGSSKVTIDGRDVEGVPTSNCHLTVAIVGGFVSRASTGDLIVTTERPSEPVKLTVR